MAPSCQVQVVGGAGGGCLLFTASVFGNLATSWGREVPGLSPWMQGRELDQVSAGGPELFVVDGHLCLPQNS